MNEKTGEDNANPIKGVLKMCNFLRRLYIEVWDSITVGNNMSGKYRDVQAIILKSNPLAIYSHCGCTVAIYVECWSDLLWNYSKSVQLFQQGPNKIVDLKKNRNFTILSDTMWSAHVECMCQTNSATHGQG